jgi:tetratricopeptide (TPR) repeat protein
MKTFANIPKMLILLLFMFSLLFSSSWARQSPTLHQGVAAELNNRHCTVVAGVNDAGIIIGNNEDYIEPFTTVFVIPASGTEYGRLLFGFSFSDTLPGYCGGVNEKGLFTDGNGIQNTGWKEEPGKESFSGNLEAAVLAKYATVEEVIAFFEKYNVPNLQTGKWLVADKSGASVVIEWGQDKLQVLRRKGKYQISTNFVQSNYPEGKYPDVRYNLAENIFSRSDDITIDIVRRVLNDTHWEDYGGSWNVTLYSYICDLKTGDVYIYNFHNYDNEAKLNIHEELKKGQHTYLISSLFPYETYAAQQYKATRLTFMLLEKALKNGVTGEEGAIAFYKGLNSPDNKLIKYSLGEEHLNAVGYALLQYNKVNEAIEIFNFMVEEFPQSANAYDSRGEAYMKAGNKELAIENYKKSLELNPNNDNAKKMLEQLQK